MAKFSICADWQMVYVGKVIENTFFRRKNFRKENTQFCFWSFFFPFPETAHDAHI